MATHVIVLSEIAHPEHRYGGWRLCLQWARYQYDDKSEPQTGYRFIWRRSDGSLQPVRGQARIPSLVDAELLYGSPASWDGATDTPTMHSVISNNTGSIVLRRFREALTLANLHPPSPGNLVSKPHLTWTLALLRGGGVRL